MKAFFSNKNVLKKLRLRSVTQTANNGPVWPASVKFPRNIFQLLGICFLPFFKFTFFIVSLLGFFSRWSQKIRPQILNCQLSVMARKQTRKIKFLKTSHGPNHFALKGYFLDFLKLPKDPITLNWKGTWTGLSRISIDCFWKVSLSQLLLLLKVKYRLLQYLDKNHGPNL